MRACPLPLAGRRALLRFLAASPVLAGLDLPRWWLEARAQETDLIRAAKDALDVFDFEAVARKNLSPAHFGYLETGTDDDGTVRANREGFSRYQLRMRRLVDISRGHVERPTKESKQLAPSRRTGSKEKSSHVKPS